MINTKKIKKEFVNELLNRDIKNVLDLGCGEGKICEIFSKRGIDSIGIDVKKLNKNSKNFHFFNQDISTLDFVKDNDLIIASLVLHFFKYSDALKIIEKMKKFTSKNGFNFLVCMSDKDDFFEKKPNNFFPSLENLKKIYFGWKIIKEVQDKTETEEHGNLGPHQHDLIFLIVQKDLKKFDN